jgi:hypothetical protein
VATLKRSHVLLGGDYLVEGDPSWYGLPDIARHVIIMCLKALLFNGWRSTSIAHTSVPVFVHFHRYAGFQASFPVLFWAILGEKQRLRPLSVENGL